MKTATDLIKELEAVVYQLRDNDDGDVKLKLLAANILVALGSYFDDSDRELCGLLSVCAQTKVDILNKNKL